MKRYSILVILLMCITFNVNALCISNEDMIKEIDNIFTNRISNSYSIEYSNEVTIKEVNNYVKSKYMLDSSFTNVYTYEDFILFNKLRDYPRIENNNYIIDIKFNITKEDEYNKVIEFGNKLKEKYINLTEEEKVYLVINYIKNNITKSDSTSLYDAIYNKNINDTYVLTQFMLSNLNIESFITERLNTGRKYNLVKLNNKWYILDIDNDYILVGFNKSDFRPDTYSNRIYVSAYDYRSNEINVDYNSINDLIAKEDKIEVVEKIEETTNVVEEKKHIEIDQKELIEWIVLIVSLCVIILVVRHYTR